MIHRRCKINSGFSFLELMVVILLLGIMATVLVPNLQRLRPGYQRRLFITELNSLLLFAWRNALITQRVHRLLFDIGKRVVRVQAEVEEKGKEKEFYDLQTQYIKTYYQWPENIIIKELFVGKEEQLQRPGMKTESTWFFLVPEGMSQEVIINALDTNDTDAQGKEKQIGLVINPFTVQLSAYEIFQKP